MPKKTWIIILLMLLAVSMSACSSKPSASDAEKVFQNTLDKIYPGILKVVSFKKTNGQELSRYGAEGYKIDFEAEIEYTADCYSTKTDTVGWISKKKAWGHQPIKKGHRVKEKGTFYFEKTEKGWRGQDGKIY